MIDARLSALPIGIPNVRTPLDGVVTAGQPTAAQFDALARSGVKTVVDLRAANEPRGYDEPAAAARAGVEYHNIPVTGGAIAPGDFAAVRTLLRAEGNRPMLVHCASANRVGAALIPYLVLDQGRTREDALRIAREVGLRSDEMARAAFAYIDDPAGAA